MLRRRRITIRGSLQVLGDDGDFVRSAEQRTSSRNALFAALVSNRRKPRFKNGYESCWSASESVGPAPSR